MHGEFFLKEYFYQFAFYIQRTIFCVHVYK